MKLTITRYENLCEKYAGYCKACKKITRKDSTEPDAREYPCPRCKSNTCYGIEEALMMGLIEVV